MDEIQGWVLGRLPEEWHEGEPEVTADREEIVVVVPLSAPPASGDEPVKRSAEAGRIERFREDTRTQRMRIADDAERRFGRKVAWGAVCGETRTVFTNLSIPVMTRLRQPERRVLDTLVEAGVARSRSDALAWAVRLVGQHEAEWIEQLRDALSAVREARSAGPAA
ncbi:hypothetical protein [Tersicoccus sp. Bi-70]|uniref:hypothetical protein n=1 Tax=Tersicoccus sp. Bi-70 TaxID=1897634 RepID=UPI000976AC86|nr:hypothetical protein [Tersicoccus sp. Bi-70]OMH35099.1 hypothetical protein BGP79_01905 [Tersicoccus sp. Bi-70]